MNYCGIFETGTFAATKQSPQIEQSLAFRCIQLFNVSHKCHRAILQFVSV